MLFSLYLTEGGDSVSRLHKQNFYANWRKIGQVLIHNVLFPSVSLLTPAWPPGIHRASCPPPSSHTLASLTVHYTLLHSPPCYTSRLHHLPSIFPYYTLIPFLPFPSSNTLASLPVLSFPSLLHQYRLHHSPYSFPDWTLIPFLPSPYSHSPFLTVLRTLTCLLHQYARPSSLDFP